MIGKQDSLLAQKRQALSKSRLVRFHLLFHQIFKTKNLRQFIMEQFAIIAAVLMMTANANSDAEIMQQQAYNKNLDIPVVEQIDPITTGNTISNEQRLEWEKKQEEIRNCDTCEQYMQPFPGDEEEPVN